MRRAQEDGDAELRAARDESEAKLRAAREEYERSHSWRLTRPLRAAARITRR
jgi:hypothetical protein